MLPFRQYEADLLGDPAETSNLHDRLLFLLDCSRGSAGAPIVEALANRTGHRRRQGIGQPSLNASTAEGARFCFWRRARHAQAVLEAIRPGREARLAGLSMSTPRDVSGTGASASLDILP